MGNAELKKAYKNALKDSQSKEKLGLTAEILLEDNLIASVEEFIKEKMVVDAIDKEKAFPENNNQTNDNADDLYKRQLISELNENLISGFATAESNIEALKEPTFEKYFTVNSPESITSYTNLQQQKFIILYALFVEKYKEQQDKKQNFFEFIQKFLEKQDVNQRVQVGLESGFKFSLSLLKEIRSINKDMLVNSLEYLYQTLRFAEPGSLYSTDKLSFMIDSNLNDARGFLISIIEDASYTNNRAVELAFKILVLLGVVRSNVEDLLLVSTLLDKHNIKVDLRQELELLKEDNSLDSQDGFGENSSQKKDFSERKTTRAGTLFYLKSGTYQQEIKPKAALTSDGQYIYMHQEGLGLLKMSAGSQGQMIGQVIQHKNEYRSGEQVSLLFLGGKLYLRAEGLKPKPFVLINPNTLEEEKDEFELEKEDLNLEWKENAETGRNLQFTPLFSDGRHIFAVAQQKAPKKKKEDGKEDDQDNADDKDDSKPPMLVVERYDPQHKNFLHQSRVHLYKNSDFAPFIKESNSEEFLKNASFATNGQVLLIQTNTHAYYFDLQSGVRIYKEKFANEEQKNVKLTYDYTNNVFYTFKHTQANTRLEVVQITNFKKGGVDYGFSKNHLGKRLNQFKTEVFGEAPITDGKVVAPNKLNLIQRIMKNVTTPVLIQHSREQSKASVYTGEQLPKLTGLLILRYIEKSCQQFDVKLDEIRSQGKSANEVEEHMMSFFKFPNATYLTHTLFQLIHENLQAKTSLINSKKTSDNLADQYGLYFILKILTANFKALSFCSISLPDLMDEEAYKQFLKSYKDCIVKIIEEGYSQDFEDGPVANELKDLWEEIYQLCLNILSSSINLIYADNKQIIQNLQTNLKDIQNEKQEENSSISLNYLSAPENAKKILMGDSEELLLMQQVFEQCCEIKSKDLISTISSTKLDTETFKNTDDQSTLVVASNKFIKSFSEQLIVQYCALNETIASKQQVSSAQTTERDEKDKKRLKDYDQLIGTFFELASKELIKQIKTLNSYLATTFEGKTDETWTGINEQYEKYSRYLDQLFQYSSGFFQIITLYVQTFSVFKLKISLLPQICQSVNSIISEISHFNTILKKYKEKVTVEADKDKLKKFFDSFSRNLCWFIGMTAYKLIKVKETEKDKDKENPDAKKEKEPSQSEKMQDLIVQSNLLSGGIENRFLTLFSQDTQTQLNELIKMSQDKKLQQLLHDPAREQEDDKIVSSIIHKGENENVDRVIAYLQQFLERKIPMVPYARLSGEDGMRLSRASFAVMIKFSEFFEEFNNLVDDVEMMWSDLEDDAERDIKIKEQLKQTPHYEQIAKRWESASKMRQWISEKKKNLIEKIKKEVEAEYTKKKNEEKKKQEEKEQKEKEAKEKQEQKEREEKEKKDKEAATANAGSDNPQPPVEEEKIEEPVPVVEDSVQIDTSTTKVEETTNPAEEEKKPEEDAQGFTEADKVIIEDQCDTKFNSELQKIYEKIIEKAEFLVKLQVPGVYLVKDPTKKKEGSLLIIKDPSQTKESVDGEIIPEPVFDWKDRLKSWRQMQTSKGAIKSFTDRKKEIFDSSVMSILACLQTPINTQRIKKQVESVFLNAAKRVAGLKLLGHLINMELPQNHRYDLISWFASSLRGNKNQMSHYLDDLKGCGLHLEDLARDNFFNIMRGLVRQLKDTNEVDEIKVILNALKWKFIARDHASLRTLDIFKTLHEGDGKKDNKLKRAWGRPIKQEVVSNEGEKKLTKEVIDLFEQVFLLTVGRIIKPDTGAFMKLKQKGTSIPTLEKAQSVIDENVSEHLIGQAFEVIFKEFERYIKIMKMFKGIDWNIYVKMRNKERKAGDAKKDYDDENLLDEDEVAAEEKKDEEEKKEDAQAPADGSASQPAEEEKKDDASQPPADGQPEEEKKEEEKKDCEEEKKDGDEEVKEEEDLEEKEKQEAIKKQEERAEREMKSIYKLYSESFLKRLLRLVEIFTSIATTSPYPLSMVQRVANPYQLETLLNLLILSSPRIKIVVLKVIQNLIKIAIPFEVFEETIKIISQDPKSQAYEILNKVIPSVKFEESLFLKFLYNYLLSVRHKMWTKSGIESEGQYSVTQEISLLLRNILETDEKHENWRRMIGDQLKHQLMRSEEIPLQELDVIFSLISGGDFNGLQAGSHAITKDKQLVTIIGFSSSWKIPGQLAQSEADILKNLKVSNNVHSPSDKVVALFFDQAAKERQELILLNLFDVTLIPNLEKDLQEKIIDMSILNDMQIVRNFIETLDKLSATPDSGLQQEQKVKKSQLSIQILKSLTNMVQLSGQNYINKLQEEGLLEKLLNHLFLLQQRQGTDKKMVPLEWIELKQSYMKKLCLENDISLIPNVNENTATILNKKQIILQSNDAETGENIIVNTHLLSAINLHNVSNNQVFKCHLASDLTDFTSQLEEEPQPRQVVEKKYGLVFMDGVELLKLDNKALNTILNSQIVVTTNDVQPKEFFTQLVELVKKDDEKEEKLRTLLGLLESVILIIRKNDYERLQKPLKLTLKPQMKSASTAFEGIMKELDLWCNIDKDLIMYHVAEDANKDFNHVAVKVIKAIQAIQDEKQKNEDKIQKLQADQKFKEVEQLKAKFAEQESKKLKEFQEKLAKIKESGIGLSEDAKSLIEKLADEIESEQSQEKFDKEIIIEDYTEDEKTKKSLTEIIEKKVATYREDKLDDAAKQKNEKAQVSEFWDSSLKVDMKSIAQEYQNTMTILGNLYSRKALVTIFANSDLKVFLKNVLKDKKSEKIFSCFLKTSFNEAMQFYLSSGSKVQLKTIKSIFKNLFKFCNENPEYTNFIRNFLRFEIIESGIKTVKSFKEKQPKSIKEYFNQEDKILRELNPYLLVLAIDLYIKIGGDHLLEKPLYIPAIYNICLYEFVYMQDDKSSIANQLLTSILKILKFLENNLEQTAKNKSIDLILNNNLLKLLTNQVSYDGTQYNNQQKLLLEIHMKILEFHQTINEKEFGNVDTNLENQEGILRVKRGKQVLKQKDQFDFIKYYIHQNKLEEYKKESLNQAIETNHYAFEDKTLSKYSMKEVEKLTIKFNEKTKLKDFCFLGIASNATGKSIEYYTQENIKGQDKEITIFRGDFYIFYPVRKQIIVAFGEGVENRLGLNSTSNAQPKAVPSTSYIAPKKVFSSYTHSVLIDSENEIFRCGMIKRSGSQNSEYQKVEFKGKAKFVACGKFNIIVVTEDNKIFRQGFSKDGHLGPNNDYANLTEFEKVDDEVQLSEKIVDVTSATHFTLFVTESGKLYGIGNRFLKEIGLDCDQKIIQVPLKENVKVLRAYGSMGKKSPVVILKVQLENGEEQFWSAGKSEQGLLGHGQLIKSSKLFKPIKIDHQATKFVDFSLHSDHAVAIDQDGNVWAWGSNLSKRAGFKDDIYDGVFEPKKLQFPTKEKLRALKVSAGFDHTLILFEDENKEKKLYSVGQDETNYYHLGISQTEAEDKAVFYREVTAFRGFKIVDFTAGHRSSHVIIEGDKEPTEGLYTHKIEDKVVKGLLHFYQDENKKWHFLSQDEYEAKKDTLPDLCFATKCQIEDIESRVFPNLIELSKDIFDDEQKEGPHKDITDCITQREIKGPRYFSFSKINGDKQKLNYSEQTITQPNINDINPLIYYRIKRPLKPEARLPILDLTKYFKESASYGLDIEIVPDFSYQKNNSLIKETQASYDESLELYKKFLPELDSELLREMDKYVKNSLSEKELNTIDAQKDFKISEMTLKNPKFKKLTENVKKKRIDQYLNFNQIFLDIMPFISLDDSVAGGDMSAAFQEVKSMILFNMKNKFLTTIINSLPTGSQGYAEIRRRKAQRFCESGKVDHKGEYTIFGQIYQSINRNNDFSCFRQNGTDSKIYSAKFIGEGSIDAGGPYRESLTNICDEIESENLPLLIKTPNNRNNHGENRDCFIPNMASNNPTHIELFKFLGYFIGYAIRTLCPFQLHFPPIFWKQVLNDKLTLQDLKGYDTYSWQIIEDLKKQSVKLSDKEFSAIVEETFVTRLSDGSEVELKVGGKNVLVTKDNLQEYVDLILEKRFAEYSTQMKAIREGIDFVIPISNLKIYTWEEVETRACGDKVLDIEKLKKVTEYYSCVEDNEFVQRFWRVLAEMNDEEQQLYLKFVWGRTRLPYDTSRLRDNHTIYLCRERADKDFPEAHTCFFQLDLPQYTTDEICKKRLITAITMCGEIDTDGSAQYIQDDNDQDE